MEADIGAAWIRSVQCWATKRAICSALPKMDVPENLTCRALRLLPPTPHELPARRRSRASISSRTARLTMVFKLLYTTLGNIQYTHIKENDINVTVSQFWAHEFD